MIKESKYIIRRILIGVGIVLVLGFLRSNKAHALETVNISWLNDIPSRVASDSTYQVLSSAVDSNGNSANIYRNRDTGYYAICFTRINSCEVFNPSQYFTFTNVGIINQVGGSGADVGLFFTNNGNLPTMNSGSSFRANFQVETFEIRLAQNGSYAPNIRADILQPGENGRQFSGYRTYYSYKSNVPWTPYSGNNATVFEFLPPTASTIISLNPVKFNTANGVIFRYFFSPEFSNFNTSNFVYQYKFGNGNVWLNLSENNQLLQVNNNGTIYVRVKDKNTDEIVDSQTYTITDIGTFATDQDYNITFSGEYRTENYLNNNISKTNSIIKEYQIYVDYLPKASILKYQYQYITSGTCEDVQTWQQVASADNGSFTYVASQNGTLCARILDSSDSVLFTNKFDVDSIGLLAFDSNGNSVNNFYSSLSNKIGFTGPISDIINIPLQLINVISTGLSGGLTCTNYPLGSLWGTNLVIPCVNVKQYLGNSLYNTIDLIIACVMIYYIIKMFSDLYTNLLFIQKNPIQDLGKRGD